jgi:hypothetical protein
VLVRSEDCSTKINDFGSVRIILTLDNIAKFQVVVQKTGVAQQANRRFSGEEINFSISKKIWKI